MQENVFKEWTCILEIESFIKNKWTVLNLCKIGRKILSKKNCTFSSYGVKHCRQPLCKWFHGYCSILCAYSRKVTDWKTSLFIWNIETMERCNDGDVKMWSLGRGPLLHLLPGPDHDRGDTATLKFPVYKSQTIKLYRTLHTFVVSSSQRISTLRKYMRLKWNLEWNIYALSHIRESAHVFEWSIN